MISGPMLLELARSVAREREANATWCPDAGRAEPQPGAERMPARMARAVSRVWRSFGKGRREQAAASHPAAA